MGTVTLKYDNGACGVLHASQANAGAEADLIIKVNCEGATVIWQHNKAHKLHITKPNKPSETWYAGKNNSYLSEKTIANCRLPAGHPEGYIEAFANHYRNFAIHLQAAAQHKPQPDNYDYPTLAEGIRGMIFLEAVVASNKSDGKWVDLQ